jgi:hypothetical protein
MMLAAPRQCQSGLSRAAPRRAGGSAGSGFRFPLATASGDATTWELMTTERLTLARSQCGGIGFTRKAARAPLDGRLRDHGIEIRPGGSSTWLLRA